MSGQTILIHKTQAPVQAQTSVDTTAGGTTISGAAFPANMKWILLQNTGAIDARVTIDGDAPTSTVGILLTASGGSLRLSRDECDLSTLTVKGITGSSSTTIDYIYSLG
jgi:hypothetical protein